MSEEMKENCFDYSRDALGGDVAPFVTILGKIRSELKALSKVEGDTTLIEFLLFDLKGAYLRLLDHLLECGVKGSELQRDDGRTIDDLQYDLAAYKAKLDRYVEAYGELEDESEVAK